jgi:hypothetical protein
MNKPNVIEPYKGLVSQIGLLLREGRSQAAQAINSALAQTYWQIGKYIVEFEQHGSEKSEYGSKLLDRLSKDLTTAYGKGFSRSNLFLIRQLYLKFPKNPDTSGFLSWSHYAEILKADDELEISFYCFVLIDLKRGVIEYNDIGQMNMYLELPHGMACPATEEIN